MLRKVLIAAVVVSFPAMAFAHLCNDVFAQAKDNLAVKVDVRDGQLRIGEQATFKVYLLNTMDRAIGAIALEIVSDKFTAEVKPERMSLQSVKARGKKESFEVTLKRNAGVPDGKYQIQLRLFNPSKKSQVFKTVSLDDAAGVIDIPKGAAIKVDGTADQAEWASSALCTGLCEYKQLNEKEKYLGNVPAADEGRLRLACDKDNLYCLFQLAGAAGATVDECTLYVAATTDDKPAAVTVDRLSGKVACDKGAGGLECKVSADKSAVEVRIPRALLGIKDAKTFCANFTRTVTGADGKKTVTYWRGNSYSVLDPIVYGQFKLPE